MTCNCQPPHPTQARLGLILTFIDDAISEIEAQGPAVEYCPSPPWPLSATTAQKVCMAEARLRTLLNVIDCINTYPPGEERDACIELACEQGEAEHQACLTSGN